MGTKCLLRGDEIGRATERTARTRSSVGRMEKLLARTSTLMPPAVGILYVALWWVAEAGRLPRDGVGLVTALLPFVVFGAGIAVSARLPVTSLTLIGGGLVLQLVVDGTRFTATSWPAYLLLLYPIVNVSARARPAVAWSSLPLAAVYAVAAGLLLTLPGWSPDGWPVFSAVGGAVGGVHPGDVAGAVATICVVAVCLAAGAWCAGLAVRRGHRLIVHRLTEWRLAQELAGAELQLAVAAERDRLTREVHDIMAHSLAVVAAQADGARMSSPELSDDDRAALEAIADTSRAALGELRRLLDGAPETATDTVGLAGLDELAARVRAAGHDCGVRVFGDGRRLRPEQEQNVYRIVQESLTNALRHGGAASSTRVALDWRGAGLALLVTTTGADADGPVPAGRGIGNMTERARLAGGWLTASADEEGAFIVNAFIPTPADETREAA